MTRESTIAEIDAQLEKPRNIGPERVARLECLLRQARVELATPCAFGEPLLEVKGWLLGEVDEGVGGGHIITLTDEPVEGCDDTAPVRVLVFVDEPQGGEA